MKGESWVVGRRNLAARDSTFRLLLDRFDGRGWVYGPLFLNLRLELHAKLDRAVPAMPSPASLQSPA